MDEAIPNPMARELYKLMGRYVYTFGRSYESINGYIVYECMMMDRDLRYGNYIQSYSITLVKPCNS